MRSNLYLLQREDEFNKSAESKYKNHIDYIAETEEKYKKDNVKEATLNLEIELLDIKIHKLKEKIKNIKASHLLLKDNRSNLSLKASEHKEIHTNVLDNINKLTMKYEKSLDCILSIDEELKYTNDSLNRLKQINVINDAFYIWYNGPYATINAFRLGNLSMKPIEFTEINAALGQACLVLSIITSKCNLKLKNYMCLPMGSFPKVIKVDDKRNPYSLFIDQGTFSFFPKRNFNQALLGFMYCIHEISEYIAVNDPTLSLPYKINIIENKIGDMSFVYTGNNTNEEEWTRSLKYMLTNIKWIIAWYCKHTSS